MYLVIHFVWKKQQLKIRTYFLDGCSEAQRGKNGKIDNKDIHSRDMWMDLLVWNQRNLHVTLKPNRKHIPWKRHRASK